MAFDQADFAHDNVVRLERVNGNMLNNLKLKGWFVRKTWVPLCLAFLAAAPLKKQKPKKKKILSVRLLAFSLSPFFFVIDFGVLLLVPLFVVLVSLLANCIVAFPGDPPEIRSYPDRIRTPLFVTLTQISSFRMRWNALIVLLKQCGDKSEFRLSFRVWVGLMGICFSVEEQLHQHQHHKSLSKRSGYFIFHLFFLRFFF